MRRSTCWSMRATHSSTRASAARRADASRARPMTEVAVAGEAAVGLSHSTPVGPSRRGAGRRFLGSGGVAPRGALVLLALAAVALFPGAVTRHDPYRIDADLRLAPPSLAPPFGTGALGRGVWRRVAPGTRPWPG